MIEELKKFLNFSSNQEYLFILPILFAIYYWKTGTRFIYLSFISYAIHYGLNDFFFKPDSLDANNQFFLLNLSNGAVHSTILLIILLSAALKSPWIWAVGINYIILIFLSRIYLNVYFPADLLNEWIPNSAVLFVYLLSVSVFNRLLQKQTALIFLLFSQILPVMLLYSHPPVELIKLAAIANGIGIGTFISIQKKLFLGQSKNILENLIKSVCAVGGTFSIQHLINQFHLDDQLIQVFLPFFLIGIWFSLGINITYRKLFLKNLLNYAYKTNPFTNV